MSLSDKRRIFIEEYLVTWNATEAARRAGYAESSARVTGHRLLTDANISEEIQRRVDEKTLTANEVLVRLGEHARGSMDDFVRFDDNGNPTLDLQAAQAAGKLNLTKKLKVKTRSWNEPYYDSTSDEIEQREVTETTVEFELYDAQAALVHIGKHHGLFTDRVDVNHSGEITTKVVEGPKDVR